MTQKPLEVKWPEKRESWDESNIENTRGWNACHDEFMKVINAKKSNCIHGMPQGQGCLRCQKESINGI